MQRTNLDEFCTYITFYSGNKLPPFYIGSTSIANIKTGYRGSVSSKKYKKIWNDELKLNPHLFKTTIISYHTTRKDALSKELYYQESLKVVDSSMYINLATAQKDGCFGNSIKGKDNPRFGCHLSEAHKTNIGLGNKGKNIGKPGSLGFLGRKHNPSTITKMRESKIGTPLSDDHKISLSIAQRNRTDIRMSWAINKTEQEMELISIERKSRFWWNNGHINKMSKDQPPGENWVKGRLKFRNKIITNE